MELSVYALNNACVGRCELLVVVFNGEGNDLRSVLIIFQLDGQYLRGVLVALKLQQVLVADHVTIVLLAAIIRQVWNALLADEHAGHEEIISHVSVFDVAQALVRADVRNGCVVDGSWVDGLAIQRTPQDLPSVFVEASCVRHLTGNDNGVRIEDVNALDVLLVHCQTLARACPLSRPIGMQHDVRHVAHVVGLLQSAILKGDELHLADLTEGVVIYM